MYLDVKNITVCFDTAMVLNNVSLNVNKGEFVALVGPNGAGKSTLFRAIAGLIRWEKETLKGTKLGRISLEGSVFFQGEEIFRLPAHEIAKRRLILTPERGRPFREMSIRENLVAAAYLSRNKNETKKNLEKVYDLFPVLKERGKQISGTLSGGELTMLAIGRSLMAQASLMLVDEPSTGLAPKIKENLFSRLKQVHDLGITILMAEQDIGYAFDLSTRNYVISQGKVIAEGSGEQLLADDMLRETYLGL